MKHLQSGLRGFRQLMSTAGITIDTERFEFMKPRPQAELLAALDDAEPGLNVFFLPRVANDKGEIVGGVSSGIPGTYVPQSSSSRSGIFVKYHSAEDEDVSFTDFFLAWVVAHETGHQLGLFHVMEKDGNEDNLSDTAPSEDNVMFWRVKELSLSQLTPVSPRWTPMQIEVMRQHPLLRW